jgi:hypothetical protein
LEKPGNSGVAVRKEMKDVFLFEKISGCIALVDE